MAKTAFLFSGQGAQHAGMGMEFYSSDDLIKQLFDSAESIRPGTLSQISGGSDEELKRTENTQPCLFLADIAAALYLKNRGLSPAAVAGFSLGELPALAFAGAFSPEDGFRLVCRRGKLMGEAAKATDAGMAAAVKLENRVVEQICLEIGDLYPVNYNCPGQLVISGKKEALEKAGDAVKAAGGRLFPLKVSGGFHSPFMSDAAEKFKAEISKTGLKPTEIPVYANLTAAPYSGDMEKTLSGQMDHPVLWEKTIRAMAESGIDTFVETGAGSVLQKLVTKILPDARAYSVENIAQARLVLEEVL